MKNIVRNNKGFSLAEVLVASAIVAGVGVSVVNLGLLGGKDKVTQNLSRSANRARQNVEAALKNPTAWDLTTNYGQNAEPFDCFVPSKSKGASAKGCNRNAGDPEGYYNFVILSPMNEKLTFEEKDPTTRVPLNSTTCDVSTPEKSEQCPLRYIAKWRPVCTTYPCENAQVEVQLTMVNDFPQLAPFNPNLYSFKIIKNFADTSVPDACRLLNGVYNVKTGKCTPKYTNKTCPNPYQVVTAVDSEGNVTCAPLYSGTCSASKPMVIGFSNAGQVTCGAQSGSPTTCPANCQGHWSECDKNIPQYGQTHPYIKPGYIVGEKTYIVTQPASNGGEACPYESGHKDYCVSNEQPPIDCTGSWSACSADCGGGNQIFSVTREASNGGVRCASNDGDQRECNTQACQAKVDCVGSWGACDKSTGLQTYSIATQAQNGGAACSAADGATQGCAVNCEGNWGACTGTTPNAYKLFTVSVTPKNGGAACAYVNGATDPSDCNSNGSCRKLSCFVAGTKITMANGTLKNIEDIQEGEKVLSYDEITKSQRIDTVDHPIAHEAQKQILHHFEFADGSKVTSNEEHPFFIVEKDNWFRAEDLYKLINKGEPLTVLNSKNKKVRILSIRTEEKVVPVYNLAITGISKVDEKYGKWGRGHNYYANGILAHNKWSYNSFEDKCETGNVVVTPPPLRYTEGTCGYNTCDKTTEEYSWDGNQGYCCPKTKEVECIASGCHLGSGSECERYTDGTWATTSTFTCSTEEGAGSLMQCANPGCTKKVNCVGYWGTCGASTAGKERYTIVTPAAGGGAACPATNGQLRDCAATCSQSWCHLNKTYSCERYSNGTYDMDGPFGSCSDENSGANPCAKPLCRVNASSCCTGGWSLDANAGKCVQDAVLNNGQYTCPNGGSLAIDGTKCAKNSSCNP